MITKAHSFTVNAPHRLPVLSTMAEVRSSVQSGSAPIFKGRAIWDTGATHTVITQAVVNACVMQPTGMVKTLTANGERMCEAYLVEFRLPNNIVFNNLRVTVGDMGAGGPDMLIGMDIIGHGDFAVTSLGGKTTFSFRLPSMERIDFLQSEKKNIGRNDPCPCGSGKKMKNCCSDKK
ncbi:MAG: retroviral-like aspartic protease family protein [Verrucomicrobiae bacterium]